MALWRLMAVLTAFGISNAVHAEHGGGDSGHGHGASEQAGKFPVPSSIAAEHEELHARLRELFDAGGKTASVAREIEKLLEPHFEKEEQFALPPLAVLSELSAGREIRDAAALVRMTDQLAREMPQMLAEHQQVVAALQRLKEAAGAEGKQEGIRFAEALQAHAVTEEQILYPAALLVGRYLGTKTP